MNTNVIHFDRARRNVPRTHRPHNLGELLTPVEHRRLVCVLADPASRKVLNDLLEAFDVTADED